jgi:Arc/MetJ family transcription regulator
MTNWSPGSCAGTNLRTKWEAVDFAFRSLVGPCLTKREVDAVRGIGWAGDLDELRRDEISSW